MQRMPRTRALWSTAWRSPARCRCCSCTRRLSRVAANAPRIGSRASPDSGHSRSLAMQTAPGARSCAGSPPNTAPARCDKARRMFGPPRCRRPRKKPAWWQQPLSAAASSPRYHTHTRHVGVDEVEVEVKTPDSSRTHCNCNAADAVGYRALVRDYHPNKKARTSRSGRRHEAQNLASVRLPQPAIDRAHPGARAHRRHDLQGGRANL